MTFILLFIVEPFKNQANKNVYNNNHQPANQMNECMKKTLQILFQRNVKSMHSKSEIYLIDVKEEKLPLKRVKEWTLQSRAYAHGT